MNPAKQHAKEDLGASDIAVIKSHVGSPFSDEYHATISGYTKSESAGFAAQKKFGLPGFTDYPKEIHVPAGEYEVQDYCFLGADEPQTQKNTGITGGQDLHISMRSARWSSPDPCQCWLHLRLRQLERKISTMHHFPKPVSFISCAIRLSLLMPAVGFAACATM